MSNDFGQLLQSLEYSEKIHTVLFDIQISNVLSSYMHRLVFVYDLKPLLPVILYNIIEIIFIKLYF